jgi:hypothetical protein
VVVTPVYKSSEADLTFAPNTISSQLPSGANPNQARTASAIDAVLATGKSPSQFVNLFNQSSSALPGVMSQLAGEPAASTVTTTYSIGSNFVNALLDPEPSQRAGGRHMAVGAPALAYGPDTPGLAAKVPYAKGDTKPLRPLPPPPLWTTWATGTALTADLGHRSSHGTAGLDETLGAIAAGVEMPRNRPSKQGVGPVAPTLSD